MDILTEVPASMRTGRPVSVRTTGRAPFGPGLPPVAGAGFHVVLSGTCWLVPLGDTASQPSLPLGPGDVVFLRDGRGHILADHPDTPAEVERESQFSPGSPLGAVTNLLCGNHHLDQTSTRPAPTPSYNSCRRSSICPRTLPGIPNSPPPSSCCARSWSGRGRARPASCPR